MAYLSRVPCYPHRVCAAAAAAGQLTMLKWLRTECDVQCLWDGTVFYQAAQNGHLDLLRWAVEEGGLDFQNTEGPMRAAAQRGHVHVLRWLYDKGIRWIV